MKESEEQKEDTFKLKIRHSDEVEEIMSAPPHWVARYGLIFMSFAIAGFLIAAWLIKYPDTVSGRVTITNNNPPARLTANMSGNIGAIFIHDNQSVKSDELLAMLVNSSKHEDIIELKKILVKLSSAIGADFFSPEDSLFNARMVLGELQPYYSDLIEKYNALLSFHENFHFEERVTMVKERLASYQKIASSYEKQKEIMHEEFKLAEKKYSNDNILFVDDVISQVEFHASKSVYLQKKNQLENLEINLNNNKIRITELEQNILDVQQQYKESSSKLVLGVEESFKQMQSQFNAFMQKYYFIAPIEGKVSFYQSRTQNQFINAGEELFSIVQPYSEIFATCMLTTLGAGKVKVNQKAKIKLDDYNFQEYGIVDGVIKSISTTSSVTPQGNFYFVTIALPNGIKTSHSKELEYKQEMTGVAEFITEDLTLLQRFFYQFRSVLDKKSV